MTLVTTKRCALADRRSASLAESGEADRCMSRHGRGRCWNRPRNRRALLQFGHPPRYQPADCRTRPISTASEFCNESRRAYRCHRVRAMSEPTLRRFWNALKTAIHRRLWHGPATKVVTHLTQSTNLRRETSGKNLNLKIWWTHLGSNQGPAD